MAGVLVVQCSLQCGVELFPLQPKGPDIGLGKRYRGVMINSGVEWNGMWRGGSRAREVEEAE